MQNYEHRKKLEASLSDLAKLFGLNIKPLRENWKWFLAREGIIKLSTTELDDEQLKKLADQVSIYNSRIENTPPDERGLLEFQNILKINPKKDESKRSKKIPE